jgi:uncharacterized SAM-binding protein YcdF (DUF218 family)
MLFWFSKVFWVVVAPGNVMAILIGLGVLLMWTPWKRLGRRLATLGAIGLIAIAVLPFGTWLARPLENRFPVTELPVEVDGIIVLGGATSIGLSTNRGQPSVNAGGERLIRFAELGRHYPNARLVFSGGTGKLNPGEVREADIARDVLKQMGFDVSRVKFESSSRNIYENARDARELFGPLPDETWLLIMSAMYMPRSIGVFREAEWRVVPVPVDYRTTSGPGWGYGFNLTRKGEAFSVALREWVGLIAYRILGRTDAFLPGPEEWGG